MSRPSFIDDLLSRPLPELSPPKLTDASNPPYSRAIQSRIADLRCHPLLESALHLLNDDLFSAHFLLRKMQEDEWGKWLHGILHLMGDIDQNARKWYEQTDSSVLSTNWSSRSAAIDHMYAVSRLRAPAARTVSGGNGDKTEATATAPAEPEAEAGAGATDARAEELLRVRKIKWEELVAVMSALEAKYGWGEVDGREAYTKDEAPSHQSRVLGEGYRSFDKAGYRT